jgi:4-amino-4-deoxy-L-arabinose transferase-like glycosyltransferase
VKALNKLKELDSHTKLAIAIIAAAITLRFVLASFYHVSGDGCWHNSVARFIAREGKLPLFESFGRDEPFWAPPLFHAVLALFYKTFGAFGNSIADFSAKMVSPLFGSLSLVFSYLVAAKLFGKRTALYATLFLAFIPLSIDYNVFSYVGGLLSFLVVLSVYFAINNRVVSSAVCFGLAILTKYNGAFIMPLLLYIIYRNNKKRFARNAAVFLSICSLIGLPWFIRNWIYLGNPVWPFFNTLFNGYYSESFALSGVGSFDFANFFSIGGLVSFYLGFFGVPNGNYHALSFVNVPHLPLLFGIWLCGTMIFCLPLLLGLISGKLEKKGILFVWIGSYILLALIYIGNAGWAVSRFMLPALTPVAVIWARGIENVKNDMIRKAFIALILAVIAGFVFSSFAKVAIAAASWNSYKDDFEWVKKNTDKDGIFMGYQCLSYNIDRFSIMPGLEKATEVDYIFVNRNFRLEPRSIVNEEIFDIIRQHNFSKVYSNNATGTTIYKTHS